MSDLIQTANIEIPQVMLASWQNTVDLIAKLAKIPASLIMRLQQRSLEVFVSSQSPGNPYRPGALEQLDSGLYCEAVINDQAELLVADALHDPLWCNNPDIKLGMISYCGLPLNWPNGQPFGTICILDSKRNPYDTAKRQLLSCFRQAVEANLATLYQKAELEDANNHLEQRVHQRTAELEQLNQRLSREIDIRLAAERLVDYQQHFDADTGLPNRKQLKKKFSELTGGSAPADALAVLNLNLANLKKVNDSFGHQAGDQLIHQLAARLSKQLPDSAFLAYFGAGEFAILDQGHSDTIVEQSAELANHLCQLFKTPVPAGEHSVTPSVAIGIAGYPHDGTEIDELLRKASTARSFSGSPLPGDYQFFSGEMQSRLTARLQIESQLTHALEHNQFQLHYQPLVDSGNGQVVGAEALLRWHNPQLGQVAPDRFIPIAEQSGQIIEIGLFVLRAAISQAAHWCREREFCIALNLSPVQFRDPDLAGQIHRLLTTYRLPPHCLEVEITEGVLLQDEAQALQTLDALTRLGVRISLDDFGTGYSSLSYLQKFPFDTVKIDRSFVAGLSNSTRNQELVRAIIAMAHKLNLKVVAEGIETAEQAAFISREQCDLSQGYFHGRPVPAETLQGLLSERLEASVE
ncbi:bifunctional diguanylate cyclase/phosphodiesterase [Marinobacterium arenosum]|uniref:bifunctional diguanylate cyclase/phosphodiesterase n=1 Tax=Marinobacterium arenosum TaxID=2862496 RepID=UPI001C93C491|nr:GGDEF and EAL domain-containing protein [Marinobacterium arenosum]MBY4677004.1 EAL domain-containing protein [Marinobacterium arenosum]